MPKLFTVPLLLLIGMGLQAQTKYPAKQFSEKISLGNCQLLDVRSIDEFQRGHLPNAMQANWNNLAEFELRTKQLQKSQPVYVYCLVGARSSAAADWLKKQGYHTIELEGGFMQWQKAGFPTQAKLKKVPGLAVNAFEQTIKGSREAMVVISTKWCPPCKSQKLETGKLKEAYPKTFVWELDGDENNDLVQYLAVESFPLILYFRNGKLVDRKEGFTPFSSLQNWFKRS